MRFSQRVDPAYENELAELQRQKRLSGASVKDLTLSNPTQAGFVYPTKLILDALANPELMVYEPAPCGLRSAREAVAATMGLGSSDITLTASSSESYAYLFKLLCDPGDAVLAPEPSYPLFSYLTTLEGVDLIPYPLAYDGVWHIDFPALEAAITPKARAILVVNPNNPTGSYLKRDEYARLLQICARRGLALISDEVFADYSLSDIPHKDRVARAAVPDTPALVFSLGGLSKSAALPQLKLGWIGVTGPEDPLMEALARLELIADSYLSVATPVQLALPALLTAGAQVRKQIRERVLENRARLEAAFGAALLPAEAGWSAVLRLPATRSDEELAMELLRSHDTLVHPGYFFDFPRGTYLVVSCLPPRAVFDAGVEAILRVTA